MPYSAVIIEYVFISAGIIFFWRRARPSMTAGGLLLLKICLLLFAQGFLLVSLFSFSEKLYEALELGINRQWYEGWAVCLAQLIRLALSILALRWWLQIAKPNLSHAVKLSLLALSVYGIVFTNRPLQLLGFFVAAFILGRLSWLGTIHGIKRFFMLIASLLLVLVLSFDLHTLLAQSDFRANITVSSSPHISILQQPIPDSMALAARLTRPLDVALRMILELFRIQFLMLFLRLLVFPVRLRGLSIKKRFLVTLGLYRIIPGFLGIITVSLIFYFGMGMFKTRLIRAAFDESMARSFIVTESLLDEFPSSPQTEPSQPSTTSFKKQRGWLGREGALPHFVLRTFAGSIHGAKTIIANEQTAVAATPGIPESFISNPPFEGAVADSAAGISIADSMLWLVTSRSRADAAGGKAVEVYIPMDPHYLEKLGRFTTTDIEITVDPTIFMGETSINFRGDSTWTDTGFKLESPRISSAEKNGFGDRRFYLARKFIPAGNWLGTGDTLYAGAVMLTLYTTPRQFLSSLTETPYFFSSNAFALLIFVVILFVFVIAELSAVRTGRSIAKGVLKDVDTLTSAARRIGGGDLEYRVPDAGKHELGVLASSFNAMAADLKRHQEELLEKERIEADLAVAKEIQQRLLPQEQPAVPGLDVAGISIPSREVGGDLFYFLPLEQNRLGLAIGDVSGKSIPAALLMSNTLAAIRAETRLETREEEILTSVNRLIADQIEFGRFVTLFYGVADPGRQRFRYSCAGHNPALKLTAEGNIEWLDESGMPLGVMPDSAYEPAEVDFEPGDIIVLYSDGVTEAPAHEDAPRPGPDSPGGEPDAESGSDEEDAEFFGESRLAGTVRERRDQSASAIIEAILSAVRNHAGGEILADDLTLIVLKNVGDGRTKAPDP